jgi:hypothetical protein
MKYKKINSKLFFAQHCGLDDFFFRSTARVRRDKSTSRARARTAKEEHDAATEVDSWPMALGRWEQEIALWTVRSSLQLHRRRLVASSSGAILADSRRRSSPVLWFTEQAEAPRLGSIAVCGRRASVAEPPY